MSDIIPLLMCLTPHLTSTSLNQMSHIIFAMLCISGRVTTVGLSRWSASGGSCRTLQRWYQTRLDWAMLRWVVVRTHLLKAEGTYLLAGDDVVISKAGQHTHGVGRFYSSLAGRPISSLSFLTVSLIDVAARRAYPLPVAQHLPAAKPPQPVTDPAEKRRPGRPTGSKNHAKAAPVLSAELTLLEQVLQAVTLRIAPLNVQPVVLDGYFGTYPATFMVRLCWPNCSSVRGTRDNRASRRPVAESQEVIDAAR